MLRPRFALLGAVPALLLGCGKDAGSTQPSAAASAPPPPPVATATAATTVTPAAAASATVAVTAAPPAGGACTFTGGWTGTYPPGPYPFSGTQFEFSMKGDGTGTTHSARADSDFAWKVEGGSFLIHGTKVEKGGRFTCRKEDLGKWSFAFAPDCNSVTMKLQQDPCRGRAKQVENGLTMKRK